MIAKAQNCPPSLMSGDGYVECTLDFGGGRLGRDDRGDDCDPTDNAVPGQMSTVIVRTMTVMVRPIMTPLDVLIGTQMAMRMDGDPASPISIVINRVAMA